MYATRHTITVTTASDGTATAYTPKIFGRLFAISYVKTDFAAGVDFTITTETTAQNIWVDTNVDATETVAPRQACHDNTGAAAYVNDADDVPLRDHYAIAGERIKIVIAQGGDTKVGTFYFLVG